MTVLLYRQYIKTYSPFDNAEFIPELSPPVKVECVTNWLPVI